MKKERYLSIEEVAQSFGVNPTTVYRLAQKGRLPGFKVGNQWRFAQEMLEAWVADQVTLKRLRMIVLVASALGLSVFGNPVYAAEGSFSDHYVEYRFGTAFKEPGVADGTDIQKNIVNFTHFNTDRLGSNFFTVDGLFSHGNDPAENGTQGAKEVYAIFRRNWSMSKITGKDFSVPGILRDVALHMGGDMNAKDAAFAPRKKLLVIGPELQFALPSGYFNLAFDYSKEWNHNGIVQKDVSFDPAFEMEAAWGIPFHLCKTSWNFTGFFTYVAPKGRDGFGTQTKEEIKRLRTQIPIEKLEGA